MEKIILNTKECGEIELEKRTIQNMARYLTLSIDVRAQNFSEGTWRGIIDRDCNILYSALGKREWELPIIKVYGNGCAVIQEHMKNITVSGHCQEAATRKCKIIKLDAQNPETVMEWYGNFHPYISFNNDNIGLIGYAENPENAYTSYKRAIIDMSNAEVVSKKFDKIESFETIELDDTTVIAAETITYLGTENSEEAVCYIDENGQRVSALYSSVNNEYIDISAPDFDWDTKIAELNEEAIARENSRIEKRNNLYKHIKLPNK